MFQPSSLWKYSALTSGEPQREKSGALEPAYRFLFLSYALFQRHVGAIRPPDGPLPRLKARDIAFLVEADPGEHRV